MKGIEQMASEEDKEQAFLDGLEWYNFLGRMGFRYLHMGGSKATRTLLDMLQINETNQVLDIGCGSGHTVCEIARRYGSHVVGVDLSEEMIKKATENAKKFKLTNKVEFRVADTLKLPFKDASFDVIIFESVLIPLQGVRTHALQEMVRVLRNGGKIGGNEAILDPNTPKDVIDRLSGHPAFSSSPFTIQSLKALFEAAGLQVVQMVEGRESPNVIKEMGVFNFMIRLYPKLLFHLLKNSRLRNTAKKDEEVMKVAKEYAGYALSVLQPT